MTLFAQKLNINNKENIRASKFAYLRAMTSLHPITEGGSYFAENGILPIFIAGNGEILYTVEPLYSGHAL